jgi:hypothetical protein
MPRPSTRWLAVAGRDPPGVRHDWPDATGMWVIAVGRLIMSVTIFQFFSRGPIAPQAATSGRTSGSLTGARQSAERPLSSTAAPEALTGDLRPAGARLQPKLVLVGSSRTVRRSGATSGEAKGAAVGGLALPPAAPQALAGVSSSRSGATTQVGLVGSSHCVQPLTHWRCARTATRWRSAASCVKLERPLAASLLAISVRRSLPQGRVGSTSGVRQGLRRCSLSPSASPKRI